jgi:hypothetical protein
VTTDDVIRWGHSQHVLIRRLHRLPPPYVVALEREYQRRRYVRQKARKRQEAVA